MTYMWLASVLLLGTHFGMSSSSLRRRLVSVIGERGFLGVFSLVAIAALGYLIWLYNQLPRFEYLWEPSPDLYLLAKLLMPVSLILAVGGFLVKNPTNVGMEGLLAEGGGSELAKGVTRITRHPFQWGVILWAVAHILANGDQASVLFFLTFMLLSGVGTVLLDRKKAATIGDDWQAYARVTSNLPFLAVVQGRNRLVLAELWQPLLVGLVVYGLLLWGHQWISGVRIF